MQRDPMDTDRCRDRGQWRVVAFQSGMIAALLAGALLLAATAYAATSMIGRTWPIAEGDALEEIEARISRQPANMAPQFGPRSEWSALKAAPLGRTTRNRVRSVVPFYTLAMDIALPGGKMLYPKGYTFNPLAYVSLPQRLVVVDPADIGWASRIASPTDWILLTAQNETGGGRHQDDALSLGEKLGRPVFILEERVKQRLGLTVAPVIVRQVGQRLELTEVHLDRTAGREARP
jgi:conjugal transfer pilus assembly protein TraW